MTGDDRLRHQRLRAMQRRATGLLGLSAAIFVAADVLDARYPWLVYVRATAEAATVGGIADWFAVTALFRHPLGIPIPHTAIIPSRKAQLGHTLGLFVERNFLSRDAVAARLASLHVAQRAARWVAQPEHSRSLARHVAAGLTGPLRVLRDEDVQEVLDRSLAAWVQSVRAAPALGGLLSLFTANDRHQGLLDAALAMLGRFVAQNESVIRERVRAESPWWIPERIDDEIHERIVGGIERTLREISQDPAHPLRQRYDEAFRDLVERLQSSPEMSERLEAVKAELVEAAGVRRFSAALWQDLKERLLRVAEAEEGWAPEALQRVLVAAGNAILTDPVLAAKAEAWMQGAVLYLVDRYREEVRQLIAYTVGQWDAAATSAKLELQVGRDLQFIRINGTLVGGLVGLGLQILSGLL